MGGHLSILILVWGVILLCYFLNQISSKLLKLTYILDYLILKINNNTLTPLYLASAIYIYCLNTDSSSVYGETTIAFTCLLYFNAWLMFQAMILYH